MKCRQECRIFIMLNDFDKLRQEYTVKDFFQTTVFHYIQFDLMKFIQNKKAFLYGLLQEKMNSRERERIKCSICH